MPASSGKSTKGRAASHKTTADLILAANLDMRQTRELKLQLVDLQSKGQPCVIDAQNVVRVSTGALQLLAAFITAMASVNHAVTLRKPAGILVDSFSLLGLSELFSKFRMEY
jgi:ABC-type transporter Mla MlaB component